MAASQFGTSYARFLLPVPGEESWIPFPHPMNDAQKMENARARARRAGVDIGAGHLNPQSGELQDPNADHWYSDPRVLGPLAVGATGGLGALFGAPAAAAPGIPALGNVNAITDALAGSAAGGAGAAVASKSLLDRLLSPEGIGTAGAIAASLAGRGDGTSDATRATEEQARRLQAITEARMRRVDPLHEAVTQLAFSRLPVNSRNGIALPRVALPREG